MSLPKFDQLVFSGGGTRCFWQGGFLHAVRHPLNLAPARISGVSGGALSSVGFIAHAGPRVRDVMCAAFEKQDSNVAMHDLVEGEGLTPHQRIYRDVVREVLQPDVVAAIANGPPLEILLGHPPDGPAPAVTSTGASLAYEAELHLINSPHFNWAAKLGVTASRVDARQAARDGQLVDLVCAAATIPPLFDLARWDGREVIDGGMVDQAPMPEPDEGNTLILLTRAYRRIPDVKGRLYIAPERETEADKIDFTDPGKIRRTWDQGVAAGRQFLAEHGMKDTQED